MKRRLSIILIAGLLVVGCKGSGSVTVSPPNENSNVNQPAETDKLRLIAVQIDRAAVGLDAAIDVKRALFRDGLISQQQSASLTQQILTTIRLVRELKETVAAVDNFEEGRPLITAVFSRLQASFQTLGSLGIIPAGQARDKIQQALAVTSAALAVIGPLLGS